MADSPSAPKYDLPNCIGCRRSIDLTSPVTFMCTKCKNYFCQDCAEYHNDLNIEKDNSCPGGVSSITEPHAAVIAKIIRTLKDGVEIGTSFVGLERRAKGRPARVKIIDRLELQKTSVKILDDVEKTEVYKGIEDEVKRKSHKTHR